MENLMSIFSTDTDSGKHYALPKEHLKTLQEIAEGKCENKPLKDVAAAFTAAGAVVKSSLLGDKVLRSNLVVKADEDSPPQMFIGMSQPEISVHNKENNFSALAQKLIDRCEIPPMPDGHEPSVH